MIVADRIVDLIGAMVLTNSASGSYPVLSPVLIEGCYQQVWGKSSLIRAPGRLDKPPQVMYAFNKYARRKLCLEWPWTTIRE